MNGSLPKAVKSFRTKVTLKTLFSMSASATMPDRTEITNAPRYGRADRKPF